MALRIHYLQHVPFEGLGSIEAWVRQRGHPLTVTRLYLGEALPAATDFDWLIMMGGPMGVHDEALHPWLAAEKGLIRAAIEAGRGVLGICLGAQLIAHVLGAAVYPAPAKEIGWLPVRPSGSDNPLLAALPDPCTVFHWHGDTFDLPAGAELLASSAVCRQQAFAWGSRVVGLQFHLEATPESVQGMIAEGAGELDASQPHIQSAEQIRAGLHHAGNNNRVLQSLLARLEQELT